MFTGIVYTRKQAISHNLSIPLPSDNLLDLNTSSHVPVSLTLLPKAIPKAKKVNQVDAQTTQKPLWGQADWDEYAQTARGELSRYDLSCLHII